MKQVQISHKTSQEFIHFSLLYVVTAIITALAILPIPARATADSGEWVQSSQNYYRLHIQRNSGPMNHSELTVYDHENPVTKPFHVTGNGFYISDQGKIIVIDAPDTPRIDTRLTVYDFNGRQVFSSAYGALHSPRLSSNGRYIVAGTREGIVGIDLDNFAKMNYPYYPYYSVDNTGRLAGVTIDSDGYHLTIHGSDTRTYPLPDRPVDLSFHSNQTDLLVCFSHWIQRVDCITGTPSPFRRVDDGWIARQMEVNENRIRLRRTREVSGEIVTSWLTLYADGSVYDDSLLPPRKSHSGDTETGDGEIPSPVMPGETLAVGNAYGEYQDFGTEYLHPGVDIMVVPSSPVYAVHAGEVKAVLTTSGEYHWRVAISNETGPGTAEGYLYAHLIASSIVVSPGDIVEEGQYIADVIEFPYNFTHIHFAAIRDSGAMWSGNWICTGNPQLRLDTGDESDPKIVNALSGQLFAFCENESSIYMPYDELAGEVDIVARMFDHVNSDYDISVQEIRYRIVSAKNPDDIIVPDTQSVYFDMDLDVYASGVASDRMLPIFYKRDPTCMSFFGFDVSEFYHIVTNTTGDTVYDENDRDACWDTRDLPDGEYIVEVTAVDVAGNETIASMTVQTVNGNEPLPEKLGVRIDMPYMVSTGDQFYVQAYLDNPDDPYFSIPVFFVLQVDERYWFWPGWTGFSPSNQGRIDWLRMDIPTGTMALTVVEPFTWPDISGMSLDRIYFYGAMLDTDMSYIMGSMAMESCDVQFSTP